MELTARKAAARGRIGAERERCVAALTRISGPLEWIDRAQKTWQGFSPFEQTAWVTLGASLGLACFRSTSCLKPIFRWSPLFFGALRDFLGRFDRERCLPTRVSPGVQPAPKPAR